MNIDKLSSVIWLFFGVIIIFFSKKLGLGNLTHPGPGFLPFWSAVILSVLSIIVFLQGKITTPKKELKRIGELWREMSWFKPLITVVALLAYTLTLTRIGFLIGTMSLLIFLLRAIDPVRWTVAIGIALLTSAISFVIFDFWLQVQLPHGAFERFLFGILVFRGST
jgi:putative tricarboxylic transport membrane protein